MTKLIEAVEALRDRSDTPHADSWNGAIDEVLDLIRRRRTDADLLARVAVDIADQLQLTAYGPAREEKALRLAHALIAATNPIQEPSA